MNIKKIPARNATHNVAGGNKKSINYSLKILTLLAFVLVLAPFNKAAAQEVLYGYGTNYPGGSSYSNNNNNSYYNPAPLYQAPVYIAPAPAQTPVVYSNGTNPNASSDVMTVNYTPTNTTTPIAKTKTNTSKTVASTTTDATSGNSLAANAVYGSNSFLPSGLIQWVLFAIFILLLVILVRMIFGGKNNYQSTPLKHE